MHAEGPTSLSPRLWVGAAGGLLATLLGLVHVFVGDGVVLDEAEWRREVGESYAATWEGLDSAASDAAQRLGDVLPPRSAGDAEADRLALFRRLPQLLAEPASTLLLLDPDGEAVAWAGEGLLQEPVGWELPRRGRDVRRGVTATTLIAVHPVDDARRPWRVVAGRSYATRPFPFAAGGALAGPVDDLRWSVAPAESGRNEADGELWRIGDGDLALFVEPPGELRTPIRFDARRWAAVVLGLTVAILALLSARRRPLLGAWVLSASLGSLAALFGAAPVAAAVLALGLLLVGWRRARPAWHPRPVSVAAALGGASFLVAAFLAGAVQHRLGPVGLAEPGALDATGLSLLLGSLLVVLACLLAGADAFVLLPGREGPTRREEMAPDASAARSRRLSIPRAGGWIAALLALGAGVTFDRPAFSLALGLAAGLVAGAWWHGRAGGENPLEAAGDLATVEKSRRADLAGLVLLAALLAGAGWQLAHHRAFHREAARAVELLGPPEEREIAAILDELHAHFDGLEIDAYLPPPAGAGADLEDLAFAVWRESPLPERDALSALVIEAVGDGGGRSTFAFGLALRSAAGEDPGLAPRLARWPVPPAEAWRDALAVGDAVLLHHGGAWGTARYFLLPRPGFRLEADETGELESNLVRGKPRRSAADGLPDPLRYALYDAEGRVLVSPWSEAPPLPAELVQRIPEPGAEPLLVDLETPDGPAHAWLRHAADGIEAVVLPRPGLRGGLERVGMQALSALGLLALVGLGSLASPASRRALRSWLRSTVSSYSKRLILVYTVLLLLPLVALNLVLLRGFSERMRTEQRENAEAAASTARSFVVDYLLGLEPGFLIETVLHRDLLEWISGLVRHQVNVYWGSRLWASSQEELFTAGLLPRRIPGEIYTRLTLLGYDTGFRTQSTGDLAYLEVYAPLDVPGIASSQQGLFLSVPLLEREEEVARDLAAMRRRALLISAGLFVVLVAVGGRLARRFTRPILELIEGTRRIARGAPLAPLEPREKELEALADAIGVMARQVEESRRKMLQEKQFVERVVAHIDAAVVSLDRAGRVVVHNKVAEDLLGVSAGVVLDELLARRDELEPLAAFLRRARGGAAPAEDALKIRPEGETVEVLEWAATWIPLPGEEDPVELLVVDDATEVLRGQRLEAWAEMARIIAHEIKNPLTPIQLSTEHLRQVWRQGAADLGPVLERCTGNVLRNVEELRQIASEFSVYSRIPGASPERGDLGKVLEELAETYRHTGDLGVEVELDDAAWSGPGSEGELEAFFDPKLVPRALRNLVENALRATAQAADGGTGRTVRISAERRDPWVVVEIADRGPGVDPQKLERIFEPYFSTHESGTGLGLAITRRIVEEHGGKVEARNRPSGGLAMAVTLPAKEGVVAPAAGRASTGDGAPTVGSSSARSRTSPQETS